MSSSTLSHPQIKFKPLKGFLQALYTYRSTNWRKKNCLAVFRMCIYIFLMHSVDGTHVQNTIEYGLHMNFKLFKLKPKTHLSSDTIEYKMNDSSCNYGLRWSIFFSLFVSFSLHVTSKSMKAWKDFKNK